MGGYQREMFGELTFPPGGLRRFLESGVDPTRRDDWIDDLTVEYFDEEFSSPIKVAEIPALLKAWVKGMEELLHIEVDEATERFSVVGVLDRWEYIQYGAVLVEMFRMAGEVGGRGKLMLTCLYIAGPLPIIVTVSPEGSEVRRMTQDEEKRFRKTEVYRKFDAEIEAFGRRLVEEEDRQIALAEATTATNTTRSPKATKASRAALKKAPAPKAGNPAKKAPAGKPAKKKS